MRGVIDAFSGTAAWARTHAELLVVAGLAVTVLLLGWTIRRAIRSGRPDRWLARVSFLVGFAWSGEAMWEVATQKLDLSPVFAGFVFFLFESQMATAMIRAEQHQERHHHPGRHGRAVWLIAVVAGAIAAMAGDSPVEVGLRLAVPLMVAHQWWIGLTGDGTDRPADAITWTWTPRRILVTLGLARPGDHDLITVDRERQIRTIATVSHRLHSTSWRPRRTWNQMRLRRLAMTADDDMLDAARLRVERVWQAADRTRPVDPAERSQLATAQAEAEAARAEVAQARAAQAEVAARAETAAEQAAAEAARRAELEVDEEALRAELEAEATRRAKAEADAEAARADASQHAIHAARLTGQAETAAAEWQRRVHAAETDAAQANRALVEEQQRRHSAEAQRAADRELLADERDQRIAAEADARRHAEEHATAAAELDALRRRPAKPRRRAEAQPQAEAEAGPEPQPEADAEVSAPRRRRTPAPSTPVTFDGAPVPDVPGVGASTVLAILRARSKYPNDTQKQLAARVHVSDRTIRAVLAATTQPRRDLATAAT